MSAADDPGEEARALEEAWSDVIHDAVRDGEALADGPILAVLLAAVTGTPGEATEGDPLSVAVLRTIRATVDAWAHAPSERTLFAAIPFVDLDLLTRRLDAAIVLVKRSPGGVR